MKQAIPIYLALLVIFSAGMVRADTLLIETIENGAEIVTPARGMTMAEVETQLGAPDKRLDAVGDPPITRWVYPDFIIYFEYDRVIHTVINRRVSSKTGADENTPEGSSGMEEPSSMAPQ